MPGHELPLSRVAACRVKDWDAAGMANILYHGDNRSAQLTAGSKIGTGGQIRINVTTLPFARITADAIIPAGDLPLMDSRVVADASVSPYRLGSGRRGGAT